MQLLRVGQNVGAINTNVLLRYLTADGALQYKKPSK